MALTKMKYGIDLGTTNSSICKLENGLPVIKKTDTLKDTLPSCVSFTKKQVIKVGDSAYNDLRADKLRATKTWSQGDENVFVEFKRTMGLDKQYESSNMGRSYSSEELSSEVLKTLTGFVENERITSCVITIPAKFKSDQIAATMRAAKMSGLEHVELLQEPIAAAIAYGLNAEEKDGNWLVFDLGGGTFDAALLNVQDGILQVKDTEGDNYLGGKNLDYAIVDEILIPHLKESNSIDKLLANDTKASILRNALKSYAELAKNQLSFKKQCDITSQLDEFGIDDQGAEIELDMVVSQEELEPVLTPFFQKTIDICKKLLERNKLTGEAINSLILVGGPTHSPILRRMLREQITPNVNTNIDPMTAVSVGAALYASTVDCEETIDDSAENLVALDVSFESNTVELVEFVSVKLLPNECKGDVPSDLSVEFVRSDKAWSSGKIQIDEKGNVVECYLLENKPNSFAITVYDKKGTPLPCFPKEITILQGTKVGSAVLPYYIGIEVVDVLHDRDVFISLKGLEKNMSLPAVGKKEGLVVPKALNSGNPQDKLIIPVYQGEYDANMSSALCNDHVFDVVISGDEITNSVVANSMVDISVRVDKSQMMTLEATFYETNETVEKEILIPQRTTVDPDKLSDFLDDAEDKFDDLQDRETITEEELAPAEKILSDVKARYDAEVKEEDGRMHLLADLRRAYLAMEKVENNHRWETLEEDLKDLQSDLEAASFLEGQHDKEVNDAKKQVKLALEKKDVKFGLQTYDDMRTLYINLTFAYRITAFMLQEYRHFDPSNWKDPVRARRLLERASSLLSEVRPDSQKIETLFYEIRSLFIFSDSEKPMMFQYTSH